MNDIEITPDFIKPYFKGKKKYANYYQAVDSFHHMSFHFDGYTANLDFKTAGLDEQSRNWFEQGGNTARYNPYFTRLIDLRRPSESDAIKAYRRNIYLPFTKMQCFKVYNSLRKIVKSPDWQIDYSKSVVPSSIKDGESLEDYCENKFPNFGSVENWVYSFAFRHMLVDANGLICVLPESEEKGDESEFPEPIPYIIPSYNVLNFKEGELAVFLVDHYIQDSNGIEKLSKKIIVVTEKGAWAATETKNDASFVIEQTHVFSEEIFPVIQLGGIIKNYKHDCKLFDSFLSPMLPGLDAATREVSDADAEVVQHVFSTMWYYSLQNCNNCQGTGRVLQKGKQIVCTSCEGNGVMAKSPYKDMVLKSGSFDQEKMPTPPAGYITKPTEIVKLMQERIDSHVYYGLSAVNMEFLATQPLSQSGTAKEVDRDELNNFVYSIAYHLVENLVIPVYSFINELRYSTIVPNKEARDKMLPRIPVPEKFDLLTESVLEQQLASARAASADPIIVNQLEIELVMKRTSDPMVRDRIVLTKQLDPFPGYSSEQKAALVFGKIATMEDITISTYIYQFVERALIEFPSTEKDKGFYAKPYKDQVSILQGYAQEKIKSNSALQKVMDAATSIKEIVKIEE